MSAEETARDQAPRVLHVIGALNVGGAETLVVNLYRGIDRSCVQFDFVVYEDSPGAYDAEVAAMGARIFRLPPPRARGARGAVADLRRVLREHGPYRAVHAHVLHASALAMRAARRERVPIRIAHSHSTGDVPGGVARRLYSSWARWIIRADSTHKVSCGFEAGAYLFGDQPWSLLRNGVNLDVFGPAEAALREQGRAEFEVTERTLLLGSVARMEQVKNHSFLIHLAARLRDLDVDFRMLFAGDGALRADLEQEVTRLRLSGQVKFLGIRADVATLMVALDALLMPSLYEGMPVVLMEAQASGLPSLVAETVSSEVDFGLGLINFLPIDSVEPWVASLAELGPRPITGTDLRDQVRAAGGDIADSVTLLYRLYDLEEQA